MSFECACYGVGLTKLQICFTFSKIGNDCFKGMHMRFI